ncbi:MAG: hypothetical protein HFJ03_03255 [Lachnospira sp.]|jgi:hypothetical protein|nr:hypothetical protein [Lachnospira sp.]
MNTKTMEGLVGARRNIDLVNTPMRVYHQAQRQGNMGAMEKAMGYVHEFADKAQDYKTKAYEGMKEEAKEAREQAQLEREKAIQKHKEEREKLEERIEENKDTDIVEVSEEGKVLLKDNTALDNADITETKTNPATQPVTYTKTGDISQVEQNTTISISL